jgi:ADP-heptose:LPS heptosyltransferase
MKKRTTASRAATRHDPHQCRHFSGYKPCFPGTRCFEQCVDFAPIGKKILLINLDAMGNVLATTSILPALKRKYPESTLTWLTEKNTAPLLQHNPLVDRILVWDPENRMILSQMTFDVAMNVDKSLRSGAFVMGVRAKKKMGFGMNENGQIVPLNREAGENYRLGLDDHEKFRVNQKTVPQLECEEFGLSYARDEYILNLSDAEKAYCSQYARERGLDGQHLVVGFNTGCSELYPNKKMTIEQHVTLIHRLSGIPGIRLLLLGGPEDTERNAEIVRQVGDDVLSTPTTEGVRRGLCYINLADVVISGDSFGMHAAIGLKKHVIVWFGVSCSQEIDLFGRGLKLVPTGLECSPCWKKSCPFGLECIDAIDLEKIIGEVHRVAQNRAPH